jgi:hypothetical protein
MSRKAVYKGSICKRGQMKWYDVIFEWEELRELMESLLAVEDEPNLAVQFNNVQHR